MQAYQDVIGKSPVSDEGSLGDSLYLSIQRHGILAIILGLLAVRRVTAGTDDIFQILRQLPVLWRVGPHNAPVLSFVIWVACPNDLEHVLKGIRKFGAELMLQIRTSAGLACGEHSFAPFLSK